MDRKKFLIGGVSLLGVAAFSPSLFAGKGKDGDPDKSCSMWPSETEGPFPTHNPSTLQQQSIVGDRTGIDFTINITLQNTTTGCLAYEGALIDIWHCDKDGNYSEYGGTSMQSADYTSDHFLRGRQVTDANGLVTFTSIFPGWYQSRATHIHVHIYNAAGTSLLVTQIAFPEASDSAVVQANSATAYGYTKGMTGYTYNADDNVFSDDTTGVQVATVTGDVDNGFVLSHTIKANGPALGLDEKDFDVLEVFPNPVITDGTIAISLAVSSKVTVQLLDLNGKYLRTSFEGQLESGNQHITFSRNGIENGLYLYRITVENESGRFEKSNRLLIGG